MPLVQWPLQNGRPCVQIFLTLAEGSRSIPRLLLADTGAGSTDIGIDLILDEEDCLPCGGIPDRSVTLGGAYTGSFPSYQIRIQIPALDFDQRLRVVGIPAAPAGFDGIACFGFLNRFTYGNFGERDEFGLER